MLCFFADAHGAGARRGYRVRAGGTGAAGFALAPLHRLAHGLRGHDAAPEQPQPQAAHLSGEDTARKEMEINPTKV